MVRDHVKSKEVPGRVAAGRPGSLRSAAWRALQSSGKLRPPASPSLRDSIRGLGRVPATKHYEPLGIVCVKEVVVGVRNALEMMFLHLVEIRLAMELDAEVKVVLHLPAAVDIIVLEQTFPLARSSMHRTGQPGVT